METEGVKWPGLKDTNIKLSDTLGKMTPSVAIASTFCFYGGAMLRIHEVLTLWILAKIVAIYILSLSLEDRVVTDRSIIRIGPIASAWG